MKDFSFKPNNKFELSDSMSIELVCTAEDLGCSAEQLLDAILVSFFWHNNLPIKSLYKKSNG